MRHFSDNAHQFETRGVCPSPSSGFKSLALAPPAYEVILCSCARLAKSLPPQAARATRFDGTAKRFAGDGVFSEDGELL